MSAAAAAAAVMVPGPRLSIDDDAVDTPAGLPPRRRRLRSMPAQAGPVPVRGAGRPLALGRDARARLGAAVRTLLEAAGVESASDAVRLATVVLAARTPSASGVVQIRTGELGRWLGLSASYVASNVLPVLQRSGVVSVVTSEGEFGQHDGLECRVLPLWKAREAAGHPLALRRPEFATLLRLLEAVMAPGWTHRDGRVTPAGLLGSRTGRGAATDRLALLLLVLEARETGRVRQCGGAVDTKRGRAAATVARLLGCTASAGERVLERLEGRGVVRRIRLRTASGLAHRTRLMVPAVAAAHGRGSVADGQEDRAAVPHPVSTEPDVAAGASEVPESEEEPQVSGVPGVDEAAVAEPDDAATLHTDHPSLAIPVSSLSLSGGFSGESRGGNPGLPDRACVREDGGPLRGEQPNETPSSSEKSGPLGPVADAHARIVDGSGQSRQQWGRVPLPPEDLRAVLAPVDLVWARLERRAARRLVEAAARRELAWVTGHVGRIDAPQVLADRLTRRLDEQMRLGVSITDPVGWLIGRALPRRQGCAEPRCDDGALLDSGRGCPRCEDRQLDRRAQRRAVAATVDTAMPGVSEAERRAATERQLHRDVTARAWAREREWEHARARQAAAEATIPAAPVAQVVLPAPRPAAVIPAPEPEPAEVGQELDLEELTREQVCDWRARAIQDPQLVIDHIDHYGETSARRLFTGRLLDRARRLSGTHHLVLEHTTWGQAERW